MCKEFTPSVVDTTHEDTDIKNIFGLLFWEISLSRQTVVEHFDRSLPLVLVVQGGWAPSRRFSCSYIWSMCNS